MLEEDAESTESAIGLGRDRQDIDRYVGGRVRLRRNLLGISQERLAQGLGLSFQQIQKYESGANRIGASRLYQLAQLLDVDVNYFFDDMDGDEMDTSDRVSGRGAIDKLLNDDQGVMLVRAFATISDERQRAAIIAFARSLAFDRQG